MKANKTIIPIGPVERLVDGLMMWCAGALAGTSHDLNRGALVVATALLMVIGLALWGRIIFKGVAA